MVATLGRPLDVMDEHEVEVNHIVCCVNDDVSFCGEDMQGALWVTDEPTVVCSACSLVDRQVSGCPFGKTCP